MHRLLRTLMAIVAVVVLSACASKQTWIMVGNAPRDVQLLVGDRAWPVTKGAGNGVLAVDTVGPLQVRIVTPDCQQLLGFEAPPGSAFAIGFPPVGSPVVEEITGQPMPVGSGLEAGDSACQ
jgi:hypothetical protein